MIRRLLIVILLLFPAGALVAEDAYTKALKAYQDRINRPPLTKRLGAMSALARTRDVRAIKLLAARYAKPRVPKDHERYLIARMCGEYLTAPAHVEPLLKFLKRHQKDADGWLWFNGMRAAAREPDVSPVLEWIENDRANPTVGLWHERQRNPAEAEHQWEPERPDRGWLFS